MPNEDNSRHDTCRLCTRPITNTGHGWYHDARDAGYYTRSGLHFAEPMPVTR